MTGRRPRIGVTSSLGGGRYMWWFYWLSLNWFGARPERLVAPVAKEAFGRFDGFVIGGGDDIGAELYKGEAALDVRIDPERDAMELAILAYAASRDVPVLGVCRGAQMLNVFMRGTLHQDLSSYDVPDLWTPLPAKSISFVAGTRLGRIFARETLRVNSLHRQAVDCLGTGLRIAAFDEFGVVQAIEDPSARFRLGVQWHPEFLIYRASHRRLFRAFIAAVKEHAGWPAADIGDAEAALLAADPGGDGQRGVPGPRAR